MGFWVTLIEQPALFTVAAALMGLLAGSFLNVVVHRLPLMLAREWREQAQAILGLPVECHSRCDLAWPRSQCPRCRQVIRAWQNIPLISYLALRGRCAQCKGAIGVRYPMVEVAAAALAVLVAWRFGPGTTALWMMLLSWGLLALSLIDAEHRLLPDYLVLPLLWLGLLLNAFELQVALVDALYGAVAGYLSLWTVFWLFKWATGKDGMGYGDFKLLALLGAWGGWQVLPLTLLLSSVLGALVGLYLLGFRGAARGTEMPFGPCLAIAGWIAVLWGDEIHASYLHMIGL